MNPGIQLTQVKPTETLRSNNVALIGQSVAQLVYNDSSRKYIRLENAGTSTVFVGLSTNTTWGSTGNNVATIASGSALTLDNYAGYLYGIGAGASTAVTHPVRVWEY